MGQSANAMLVYGYHLGSGDSGWLVQDAGEFGELPALDWYSEDGEDAEDFVTAAEKRLLAQLANFTETDWRADGYFDRERAAKAALGVEFESHCSGDYPMYLLAAKVITVYRGSVKELDLAALAVEPEMAGWDDKLRAALAALSLTPVQDKPKWILCSYWG
jgi:hypothetical protein